MNFDPLKFYRVLDIRQKLDTIPDTIKIFFKCGIVLHKRNQYDLGYHTNDIQDCEIEYANKTDEELLKNYNELYKFIMLKWGHLS